jgi:hypothetical protein
VPETQGSGRAVGPNAGTPEPAGQRLTNLAKLYHVPVFALRKLLEHRVPGARFGHLSQPELVSAADQAQQISEADVEALYDDYRYGQRLSSYLYLLPEGLTAPTIEEIQAALNELMSQEPGRPGPHPLAAGEGDEALPDQVVLTGEERLEKVREIRFRYFIPHRFVNADGQPDRILETRYGFLWLDLELGYVAIFTGDERVNDLVTRALAASLQAIPLSTHFSKELLDQHFSIEKAKRLSYYDPGTGVRRSISGRDLWHNSEGEILAQEQQYVRPASLYDEEIAQGVTSGLGVTSNKGRIYFTKTLPGYLVRAWGLQRFPDMVRDLKDMRAPRPGSFSKPSIAEINRMRLPSAGKAAIVHIVEGLLQSERDGKTSVALPLSGLEIYRALKGKYFQPYLFAPCSECEETAELCPHCEGQKLHLGGDEITCKACGAVLSDGESISLQCIQGHTSRIPQAEAFGIAPNHWLQKRMTTILGELGQPWDLASDYFHIEGSSLFRLRKGQAEAGALPQIVQNYISNFWDPVTGQVHTGSGDIVAPGPAPQDNEPPSAALEPEGGLPRGEGIQVYKNFDLRLRRNGPAAYSVEATASDGGSVLPQPLVLPLAGTPERRLAADLRRITSAEELRQVGEMLFDALFPTRILKLWERTVGSLGDQTGLRIRLHVEPAELMGFPWEVIHEEEFLGLRLRFPIIRFLDLPDTPRTLTVRPPLRILVAVAQPVDSPALNVDGEVENVRKSLEPLMTRSEVHLLSPAGRDDLLAKLRQGYHILHYIGHGAYQDGEGFLILEDQEERADRVSASLLGQMVADSNLRLALLNTCQSATTGGDSAVGGLAHRLVKAGLPAVVAMQQAISDGSSVAFSRGFYGALAAGWPIDAAVQEGRNAILSTLGNGWEAQADWAVPALYMRAPNGALLESEPHGPAWHRRQERSPSKQHVTHFYGTVQGPILAAGQGVLPHEG